MLLASVSKARAVTATISCLVLSALILILTQGQGVCCTGPFLINAAIFGFIWYRKVATDKDILRVKVREESYTQYEPYDQPRAIMPPPSSRGSNGSLFVPDPDSRDPYL